MTRIAVAGRTLPALWMRRATFGVALLFSAVACTPTIRAASTAPEKANTGTSTTGPSTEVSNAGNPVAEDHQVWPSGIAGKQAQAYYYFVLGHLDEQSAERYGRPDLATKAVAQYQKAIQADPNSAFLRNNLATTYFNLGRVREAMQAAQEVLKNHPDNLAAHKLLGRIYLRSLGDSATGQQSSPMLALAIAQFQKIVALDPDKIESHLLLGQLYELKLDSASAKAQFDEARKIDPGSGNVALSLARLYSQQGKFSEAADVLKEVPESERTPKVELALGAMYDQLKKPKEAISAYQAAISLQPDNLDAQRALAEDLLSEGEPDAALKIFEGIATEDPHDIHSFLRLAEVSRMQGNLDKAESALQHARSLDPSSTEVRFNQAMIDVARGHLDQAATLLEKLVAETESTNGKYTENEKNNRAVFLAHLARVYRDQNKTAQAVDLYQKMIALGGANAERGYQGEIDAYRSAKMLPEATAAAQKAVQALPKSEGLKLTLASQLVETGKAKQGIDLAKAQLNGSDKDRAVWLTLAQLYTRTRQWKPANAAIDRAAALSDSKPEKALVYFLRGALQEQQKHIEAAEQQFHQSLELDPDNPMTLNYLGYMLADRGLKLNEALKLIEHAVRLDPENGAYLDSLGWVHYKMGQYDLAKKTLKRAVALMPTDPTVRDHLGQVYASTGQLRQAVVEWQSSLDNYAHSSPLDAQRSDVEKVRKRLDKAKSKLAREQAHAHAPNQP